jgi:ABC-2 type transport system ATP-binding protein
LKVSHAIVTQELTRRFGDLVAVDDLSLDVAEGEIFGFLGHNGAGKTTTVRLLNGLLAPSAGRISVLGLDPLVQGPSLRRHTGVLTETPSLAERLTGREILVLFARIYGVGDDEATASIGQLLEEFELDRRADELVGSYSKGMRQRLALARTLLHQPRLIFLDEPTSGLDPVARRNVHELILRLHHQGNRTIFLCTHDLYEAQSLCDRVAVLEHGRLAALGTPEGLARRLQHGLKVSITLSHRPPVTLVQVAGPNQREWELAWDPASQSCTIRLLSEDEIPDLVSALVAAGARIYKVVAEQPTLEDVYFALHDGQADTR